MGYECFGVLLCSVSGGVMNVPTLKKFIDTISKMGYNLLELCIDDMIKIDGEPYYGYLRGGYTHEDIKEIDKYAISKGVELVPCVQTLGHFSNILRHPCYYKLADTGDILLADNEETYQLIEKLISTISECFTSRKLNIGFDEAHDIGRGRYLDKHGFVNHYDILLRHLNKVVDMASKYGMTIHMWSDMFCKLANNGEYVGHNVVIPKEVVEKVPKSVGLCYWNYGNDDESLYDDMLKTHEAFGDNIWFAGAACTYKGFAPMNRYSLKRLKPAMKQVAKHHVKNVLVTLWGDDGNECSFFSVLPSLYAARQYADGNFDEASIRNGFKNLLGVDFDDFLTLDIPNKNSYNDDLTKLDQFSKNLLYNDCFLGVVDEIYKANLPVSFHKYAEELRRVASKMGEYAYLFTKIANLCDVLELKATLGIETREAYKNHDCNKLNLLIERYKICALRVKTFKESFREEWMRENKPYNWRTHEIRLSGVVAQLEDYALRLKEYLQGGTDNIPELEEEILSYSTRDWFHNMWYSRNFM